MVVMVWLPVAVKSMFLTVALGEAMAAEAVMWFLS